MTDDCVYVCWRMWEDRPRAVPADGDHMDAWGELIECGSGTCHASEGEPIAAPSPSAARRRETTTARPTAE